MTRYLSRQELAEWIDNEGIYYFITVHGFDSSEIDPEDTEFLAAWKKVEEAAWALYKADSALDEFEGFEV